MGIDFIPENNLEKAVKEQNTDLLMIAIAEEEVLTRLISISCMGAECFTDEMIFAMIFIATPPKMRQDLTDGWFYGHLHAGERIKNICREALAPLPNDSSPGEKALVKALIYNDNDEVIRLIEKDGIKFNCFAPDLLLTLKDLAPRAAAAFLEQGLSSKLKAIVLGILLQETASAEPALLSTFSYSERMHFANLMLKIVFKKRNI